MPKAKPKWGYNFIASTEIETEPTAKEIDELIETLSQTVEIDLKEVDNQDIRHPEHEKVTFRDFLHKLITEYRNDVLYERNFPTKAVVHQTLDHLDYLADELLKRFEQLSLDEGLDERTWYLLEDCFPHDHGGLDQLYDDGAVLKNTIHKARSKLDKEPDKESGRKSDFSYKVRLAKHLAFTFKKILHLEPSKTKGGTFDECVGLVIKACDFEEGEFRVPGYKPAHNFKVISLAIDELEASPLRFDYWGINKPSKLNLPNLLKTSGSKNG